MRKLFWLISGISIGLAVAKQIEQNPAAKAIANDVERAAREFGNAVVEGFREREEELAPKKPAAAAKTAARKPAARKPAARKPAARKPAAKPSAK
jgi:sRNA-binding protein